MALTYGAPAVFIDKDGTLLENVPYNVDPSLMRFRAHAETLLRKLDAGGYLLFIVTNQSGVARGLFPESALTAVEERIASMISEFGVTLSGFYYCPHASSAEIADGGSHCACRKPEPGMLLLAAQEHQLSLADSWLIGDILDDIEAGRRAGCRTVLVREPGVTETARWSPPDFEVSDLAEAASVILRERVAGGPAHPAGVLT